MVVRLRLARHGTKNNPFYHVVAIRDKAAREARPIEKLGEYDPIPRPRKINPAPMTLNATSSERVLTSGLERQDVVMEKRLEWNTARIHYWLEVGAQPSKPVARLLDKAGLVPPGKTYKGIYRPPGTTPARNTSDSLKTSPSAILQAAGALPMNDSAEPAATALREDETAQNVDRTDPRQEAAKVAAGEATIDQAA